MLLALVAVSVPASAAGAVSIGVFSLFKPRAVQVRAVPGSVLRLEAGKAAIKLEGAESATVELRGRGLAVSAPGQSLFTTRLRTAANRPAEFLLSIPGKIERKFWGELSIVPAEGVLSLSVGMDLETAVASVVAAEAASGTPAEALKAQAVAARSYYLAHPHGRHAGYDFCDTTHCQFLREPPPPGHVARQAAVETRGLTLAFQGQPIDALYSASCGGRTHSLAELGMPAAGYPYFAVECAWCRSHATPWEKRVDAETAAILLGPRSERQRIDLARALGWQALPGNDFQVVKRGDQWMVIGKGAGHGIGLCQRGAAAMAAAGASFVEILAHYYPNTRLVPWKED